MAGRDYYSLKLKKTLPVAMASGVEGYWWLFFSVTCLFTTLFKDVLPAGACSIPDDYLSFYDLDDTGWLIADCVVSHLVAISLLVLSALALCALVLLRFFGCMSVSGLLNGVELVRAHDGGRVDFKTGLKFIFLRPGMMGFILLGFVFLASGGVVDLYIVIKIIFVSSFIGMAILVYDLFLQQECTVIERISGTRFILSHKGQKYWDEKASRMRQGWRHLWHALCFYSLALIYSALLLVFGFISFNLMREPLRLNTPEMLAVYDRPAPIWDDNLVVAVAGLLAPQNVTDSYEYGQGKSAFYIRALNKTKDTLGIRSHTNVPDALSSKHSLEIEKDEISEFREVHERDLRCFYDMNVMADREKCPVVNGENIHDIIDLNPTLWTRFQQIPKYKKASVLDDRYPWKVFVPLVQTEAAYILSLQKQGRQEDAVDAWLDYLFVYDKIVYVTRHAVEKVTAYLVYGIHIRALENLLFNDPSIARDRGDELLGALTIHSIDEIGANNVALSEWAYESLLIYMNLGVSPALNKVKLDCIKENRRFSAMSPLEFFAEPKRDICPNYYSSKDQDVLAWSLSQPGFFVTNIMQLIFTWKDDLYSVIKFSHDLVSKTDLARAAIYILKNDIPEERIPDTLKTMKTGRPILWDAEKKWLYVENPHEVDEIPNLNFRLNLERKVQ